MRHLGIMGALLLLACSGGGKQQGEPEKPERGPDKDALCSGAMTAAMDAHEAAWNDILAKGEPTTLEQLAAAACQRFCGRATECAIQDACDQMDAAAIADLQLDKTAPQNTAECVTSCNSAKLTKQQITTLGTCAQDDTSTCATFRDCTGPAQPGS